MRGFLARLFGFRDAHRRAVLDRFDALTPIPEADRMRMWTRCSEWTQPDARVRIDLVFKVMRFIKRRAA